MLYMCAVRVQVMAQIAGDVGKYLPWEDAEQAVPLLATLGLLQRNPAHRLAVQEFVHACDRVLASTTQGPG